MKYVNKRSLFFVPILLLAACSNEIVPDANSTDTSETEESQGDEAVSGTLNFYTSQPDADAEALVSAFNEIHPDVDVQVYRSGTEEVMSKISAEQQAGSIMADVLLVADDVTFESLKSDDLLLEYQSSELEHIPDEFIDSDNTYTGTKAMATILAINTNEVTEVPDSWNVLIEEDAKGKAIMPSPLYSGAAAYNVGVLSKQEAFGWDFFEQLAEQDITMVQGNGGVLQAVAAGEQSYGMVVDFITARAKAEGSPVELVYPKEGVPIITEPIGIMKDSENVEAAKAFVDFTLSEEGQELAVELGYTPIREGIETPEGLVGIDELNELMLTADVQELLSTRDADKQQFTDIMGQ